SSPADGVYGDPVPTITAGYLGFVYTQGAGDLGTAPSCGTSYTHVAGSGPGNYATSCAGGVSANYDFSYHAGNFHVGKATLDVTASSPADEIGRAPCRASTAGYLGVVYTQGAGDLGTAPSCGPSDTPLPGSGPGHYATSRAGRA